MFIVYGNEIGQKDGSPEKGWVLVWVNKLFHNCELSIIWINWQWGPQN